MVGRTESLFRRALSASGATEGGLATGSPAQVFTQGFLNASLLQLAVCAPPRQAATTRRYSEIYVTEPGGKVRQHSPTRDQREAVSA